MDDSICPFCQKVGFVSEAAARIHMIDCKKEKETDEEGKKPTTPYLVAGVHNDEDRAKQPKDVYELRIYDFVLPIDPHDYFITSGEAVIKAERMLEDYQMQMSKIEEFLELLKEIKGPAKYLETSYSNQTLLIKRKNPRKKKKKEEEPKEEEPKEEKKKENKDD